MMDEQYGIATDRTNDVVANARMRLRQPTISTQPQRPAPVRSRPIESSDAEQPPKRGTSAWRLTISYFKACFSAFLVFFLLGTGFYLMGQPINYSPGKLFVAACFSWVFGIPLLPVVMAAVVIVQLMRIPRGYADVLVGTIVGCVLLIWQFKAMGVVTAWALKLFVASTFGGYAFWRAEGMPGASAGAKPDIVFAGNWLHIGLRIGARLWR